MLKGQCGVRGQLRPEWQEGGMLGGLGEEPRKQRGRRLHGHKQESSLVCSRSGRESRAAEAEQARGEAGQRGSHRTGPFRPWQGAWVFFEGIVGF